MLERGPERPTAATRHLAGDLVACRQSDDLGLLDGAVELVLGQMGSEVVKRSCRGGERQAVLNGGIEGEGSMDLQARAGSLVVAGDRDVDLAVVWADTPDLRCGVVAQHAAGSKDRRHLKPPGRSYRADLVDTAKERHEPSPLDASRDCTAPDGGVGELRRGDDAVLPASDRHDRPVAAVHFAPLTPLQLADGDFGTRTVRFAPLTRSGPVSGAKCTLAHAYWSPSAADLTPQCRS